MRISNSSRRLLLARVLLPVVFLFCFAALAEIPNSQEPTVQDALTKAWKQVQAIKHPLLKNASKVKPSFVDAGHGLVSAVIDFKVNAEWNPKGPLLTSPDPVPIDAKHPYLFIQVSVYSPSPLSSQPHVRSRGFRAGDIDYSVLVTVASSDADLSNRVESILTRAFDPWHVYPNSLSPTPPGATPPIPANLPPDSLNPPGGVPNTPPAEKDSWQFSAAYRGLTPLSEDDAKRQAIHECELYGGTTANVVISVTPVKEQPDYFRVLVRGRLEDKTLTHSVLIHRINAKGNKIERVNDPSEEPTVATLTALLGHPMDDKVVTDFVTERGLKKYNKFDSGGFRKPEGSFSLLFRGNKISRIIISLNRVPEISTVYQGTLPYGARASDSPRDIRKRMGKAEEDTIQRKGGGGLKYERDRIEVTFAFDGNKMEEIDLDSPTP